MVTLGAITRMMLLAVVVSLIAVFATMRSFERQVRTQPPPIVPTAGATVVDVARGVDPGTLASVVQIGRDERIVAVDDLPVANDIAAGAAIGRRSRGANTYLDLTVAGPGGARRVLVLLH